MRQIIEIIVENFQSHKKSVIKPAMAGGVTTIVGPSRNGKSAVFRALRKFFYNVPEGTGFIRSGTDFCKITVKYNDGYTVSYYRTRGSVSRYTIIDPDGTKQDYDEGRAGFVPLEVQQITWIRPVTVGDLSLNLNLAEQLEGPFLGTKSTTAPARAKIIGKLAGTEEIDYANKQLGTDLFRRRQDEKQYQETIKTKTAELTEYDYLDELKGTIDAVEAAINELREQIVRRNKLQELATQRGVLQVKIKGEEEAIGLTQFIDPAAALLVTIEKDLSTRTVLQKLREQRSECQSQIICNTITINAAGGLDEASQIMTQVVDAYARREKLNDFKQKLLATIVDINQTEITIEDTAHIAKAAELLNDLAAVYMTRSRLLNLNSQRNEINTDIVKAQMVLMQTEKLDDAAEALAGIVETMQKKQRLQVLNGQRTELVDAIAQANAVLTDTAKLDEAMQVLVVVIESVQRRNSLIELFARKNRTSTSIGEYDQQINIATNEIQTAEDDYYNYLLGLGRCPICGGEIKKECLKEVV